MFPVRSSLDFDLNCVYVCLSEDQRSMQCVFYCFLSRFLRQSLTVSEAPFLHLQCWDYWSILPYWFFCGCWRSTVRLFCLCGRYLLPKPSFQAQVWILLLSYMLESKTTLPPLKVLLRWQWLLFLSCCTYNGPLECIPLYSFLLLKVSLQESSVWERIQKLQSLECGFSSLFF